MKITDHFRLRAESRGLDEDVLEVVFHYGVHEYIGDGKIRIRFLDRYCRGDLDPEMFGRARGWSLVVTSDYARLITCYRENTLGHWKRQPDRRTHDYSLSGADAA